VIKIEREIKLHLAHSAKIHIPLIVCMKFEYKILMFKDTHQP